MATGTSRCGQRSTWAWLGLLALTVYCPLWRAQLPASANPELARPLPVESDNHCIERAVWSGDAQSVVLCQATSPAAPYPIRGIDAYEAYYPVPWSAAQPMDWQPYAQGEYTGHERIPHVPCYRLRFDDVLELVFRMTRNQTNRPYTLNVGDEIRLESSADPTLDRNLLVQPDGTVTLRLLGQVKATRHTVPQLREEIELAYQRYYRVPAITVTPLRVNTKLEDLRATVDSRFGFGGQARQARVTPEGTIALPAIGSCPAQGLTLNELKRELDERYAMKIEGFEVTPVLLTRAPRYVYVLGEVARPGRYDLQGPTTVMQALSLAGGWNVGGNLRQTVIFRRGDDWRLMATLVDIRGALYGKVPVPADELWVNDSDVLVVPKAPIKVFNDYVNLTMTQGVYSVVPFRSFGSFSMLSTLGTAGSVVPAAGS
jgi:polysaccharide biosynthesis/export protein